MATLLVPIMGFQCHYYPRLTGRAWLCKHQANLAPVFKTNSPHCDGVMAIEAPKLLVFIADCCVKVAKCDSEISDSIESFGIWERFSCDLYLEQVVLWTLNYKLKPCFSNLLLEEHMATDL
jgi:hypothetical protein